MQALASFARAVFNRSAGAVSSSAEGGIVGQPAVVSYTAVTASSLHYGTSRKHKKHLEVGGRQCHLPSEVRSRR
jgi:hypothetical protein